VRDLIRQPESKGTDISLALQTLNRLQRRKSIVFLLSDFQQSDIRRALSVTRTRHDLIAVSITDPREVDIPDVGLLTLEDSETGEQMVIDTSSRRVREALQLRLKERRDEARRLLSSLKIDHIELQTDKDFASPLVSFFTTRIRRKGA
jgi:uncharacterized protein (DUF58 family)